MFPIKRVSSGSCLLLLSLRTSHLPCPAVVAFQFLWPWAASCLRDATLSVLSFWGTLPLAFVNWFSAQMPTLQVPPIPIQCCAAPATHCLSVILFYLSCYFSWFEMVLFVNSITISSPVEPRRAPSPSSSLFTSVSLATTQCPACGHSIYQCWG